MRWPLRNQILLPLLLLLFTTVAVLTGLSFYSASRSHQQRVENELREVAEFLARSNIPLTASVLRDMKSLSGADFVLVSNNRVDATTLDQTPNAPQLKNLIDRPTVSTEPPDQAWNLRQVIQIGGDHYYHQQTQTASERMGGSDRTLHLLLKEDSYRQLWWQNVWPSIVVGLVALPIVGLVATWLSTFVTQPMSRLQHQVEQVAGGNWTPLDIGNRNDEIRDLSEAVNQMAQQLAAYESEVRKKERLETLVDLGSGIAHHLRNSATGCRMAIQLSQLSDSLTDDTRENLQVALRQLALMDKYIQRFLSLDARSPSGRSEGPIDWIAVNRNVIELLRPSAKHLGVTLKEQFPDLDFAVLVPLDDLEQVLMNLVTNALDAAAENATTGGATDQPSIENPTEKSCVWVEFSTEAPFGVLRVIDTGIGPPGEIHQSLFDSFVTRKKNGVGLGLYLTQQIVQRHRGSVTWSRTSDNQTCFEVRLPSADWAAKQNEIEKR